MTDDYLGAVRAHLDRVPAADRRRALDALGAQLAELADAGFDPVVALGDPVEYAAQLREALAGGAAPGDAQWRLLGLPVETRGPVDAEVRSRVWDPTDPRVVVPRLFGIGWRFNLGAVAVRLGLLRPDDVGDEVLARITPRDLRRVRAVPLALAGAAGATVALAWRRLPPTVPSGFGATGRAKGGAPRWTLLGTLALGAVPALWSQRGDVSTGDALVRSANATSLAAMSASVVAATVAEARRPGGRWGLFAPVGLVAGVAGALGVIVVPVRSALRRAWEGTPGPSDAADH